MGRFRCSYKSCTNQAGQMETLNFFGYPIYDNRRLHEWIHNAEKPTYLEMPPQLLSQQIICQLHFEERFFTNESKTYLYPNAVPTLDGNIPERDIIVVDIIDAPDGDHVFASPRANPHSIPDIALNCGIAIPPSSSLVTRHTSTVEQVSARREEASSISNTVNRHSREIAKLNRTIKKHIFTNNVIRQFRQKSQILNQLRGLIPSSLHAVVGFHLSKQRIRLSKNNVRFISSLYQKCPTTYKFLMERYKWRLPSTAVAQSLASNKK